MSRSRLLSAPRFYVFSTGDARSVYGIRLGFKQIGDTEASGDCIGQSHYFVDVIDKNDRRVMFTFYNNCQNTCSITDIVFHDGEVLPISIQNLDDVDGVNNLSFTKFSKPGINQIVKDCSNNIDASSVHDGIKSNESLGIVFDLQCGITMADIIAALSKGSLNIGIKVHGGMPDVSMTFINESRLSLSQSLHDDAGESAQRA